jgi:hypothetical protein
MGYTLSAGYRCYLIGRIHDHQRNGWIAGYAERIVVTIVGWPGTGRSATMMASLAC